MAFLTGRNGAVKIGSEAIVNVTEFTVDVENDMEELTYLNAAGWKQKQPNMSNWTASVTGKWNMDDTNDTSQQDLQNNILGLVTATMSPTDITLDLYVDVRTTPNTKYYHGNAVLKSLQIKDTANGIPEVTFQFEGDGKLQYLTA